MNNYENNSFYSYNGHINRKNYIINLLILLALYVSTLLVNWNVFFQFTPYKFLIDILMYVVLCFQFIIVFCSLSVIYRRISDITKNKNEEVKNKAKTIFALLYVFPIIYLFGIKQLVNFAFIDLIVFCLLSVSSICAIVLCFIKGK